MPREDEFLQSLRATFKVEAAEHLQILAAGLLEFEAVPPPAEPLRIIEQIFRAAHSLKGAARAVSFTEVESSCQSLEDVFAAWKRQRTAPSPRALDTAHRVLDAITEILAGPSARAGAGPVPPRAVAASEPMLEPAEVPPPSVPARVETPVVAMSGETVRIPVAKLDARLLEAEEMLTAKMAAAQRAAELRGLLGELERWTKEWLDVQADARAFRQTLERRKEEAASPPGLRRVMEFFAWNEDFLRALQGRVAALSGAAEQDRVSVGKLVDDLLEDSKKLLMLPLSTHTALFRKLVRDLCRYQGKEAELLIHGEDFEIDKRILDEMKDPLVHILRNCVDHGIETPAERQRLGKPARAVIRLTVSPINGNKVELTVADDGAGIDPVSVRASALKHGTIRPEEAGRLTEQELLELVFRADVSTSPIITRLSGRGLGLAIVREKTEQLNGHVSIESIRHAGTALRITLPITLATFRGVLIEVENSLFVVPTTSIERLVRFHPEDVQTVEGRETLAVNGRAVALCRLASVLQLPPAPRAAKESEHKPALILGVGERRIAFAVDAVVEEREVLVKPLPKPLVRVRHLAAATILATGQVVPILHVNDLLKSARRSEGSVRAAAAPVIAEPGAKSILVAEDSITSRMLVKNILQSAGYRVKTAVDGLEAFATLRVEHFDLVVSDVEMPRLNGFDLTARIRADKQLAELPVILVTALESREHRERGIDVGANAYLIKSSFDQSNLLEAIRRLL